MDILAIDLGKFKSAACVLNPVTGEHRAEAIESTPEAVRGLLERHKPARVVIEIGAQAGWVCDVCRGLGVRVQVANTMGEAWKWKNTRRKTDQADALKLAKLSAMESIQAVWVPERRVREWRELIGYRQSLVKRRTMVKNTIRALLTSRAVPWAGGCRGWTDKSVRALREMASVDDGQTWRLALRLELDQLDLIRSSLKVVEEKLDALAQQDARVALLRTIPGVGPRLAEAVVALIDDPGRFSSGRQVGCYAGLTPRQYQSGTMNRQGRISGQGNPLLRCMLVEVGWMGRQYNPWMEGVYQKVLKGSPSRRKIAITALARRILVVCWAMLRDNRPWTGPAATPRKTRPAGRASATEAQMAA